MGINNARLRRAGAQNNAQSDHKMKELLPIQSILTRREALKIKLFFNTKRQIEFIESLMVIKGTSNKAKGGADLHVLKKMGVIYQESKDLIKVSHLVCHVIVERMESGFSLGEAMVGLFGQTYCTLFSASSSGGNISNAIGMASKRQGEVLRTEIMSTLKLYAGFVLIIVCGNILNLVHQYYLERKEAVPKAFKFFKEPNAQFVIADFIATYTIPLIAMVLVASIVNRIIIPNLSGNRRVTIDAYYPPALLYRNKLAMSLFTNITLLIKDAGIQPRLAIDKLIGMAQPYEKDHLEMIKHSIITGAEGTEQFSTGLLPEALELRLRLAGQGEQASVRTALDIITTTGQEQLVNNMKRTSTLLMIVQIMFAVWVLVSSIGVGVYLMRSLRY